MDTGLLSHLWLPSSWQYFCGQVRTIEKLCGSARRAGSMGICCWGKRGWAGGKESGTGGGCRSGGQGLASHQGLRWGQTWTGLGRGLPRTPGA